MSTTSSAKVNRLDGIIAGEGQEARWQGQTLQATKLAVRCGGIGYVVDALSVPAGEAAESNLICSFAF